jgi:Fur family transcriptional regulator, zinc uptake regulator
MNQPHHEIKLTKNQELVMGALADTETPLSAYDILDQLRVVGFRGPPQVYRALERLVEFGMVHRLESLNAFVACRHDGCDPHKMIVFASCERCKKVSEIVDKSLAKRLETTAATAGFVPTKSVVELHGICAECGID